jgi:hypothetical protein
MSEIITKIRTAHRDTIQTENYIFKRNMTSKEERERGGGGVREVTCNSGCHPQHEGLRVCTVRAVRGNMNVTFGFRRARNYRGGYRVYN